MTLVELSKLCFSKEIHLIRVEVIPDFRESLVFVGSLEEYLDAIKVLGARAIFVSTVNVTEERFVYTPRRHLNSRTSWPFPTGDIDDDEEIEEFDLCSAIPELGKFKEKIGQDGYFELSACNLTFSIYEDWMQEMELMRDEAQEIVEAQKLAEEEELSEEQEQQEAEEQAKLEAAVKNLHALIADKNFVRLPTQRAMRAYAIDKIPELENLDDAELKREIQDIGAKIQARSLARS
jgi:hypothetical protein